MGEIARLSREIGRDESTSRALAEERLAGIARTSAALNCFIHVAKERALTAAGSADNERRAGRSRGPLHGIPMAWKDVLVAAERRPTGGAVPSQESGGPQSTIVDRLLAAGAVPLGALNMDEFAAGGTGANAHFGRCTNPWDTRRITGGSSGESAAAVAAGLVPFSIGSDAGGSTRLPAAMCGVTGLKPTYGRISRSGALARSWSMDCLGPVARSAEDCATVFQVIAGPDPADPTTLGAPAVAPLPQALDGIRIGVALSDEDEGIADFARQALTHAVAVFADLGFAPSPVQLRHVAACNDLQQILVKCEAATMHGRRLREAPESIGIEARSVIREGLLIPATRYIEALSLRQPMLERFVADAFASADVILAPVYPDEAPEADSGDRDPRSIEVAFTASAQYTRYANYLGLPALSVPAGFGPNGMPLAFQLIGRPFSESLLLATAMQFQGVTSFHLQRPPVHLQTA